MVRRVLMVAFHYPPCHGSSGIQRTLKFSQYLPEFGWEPIVLSAHPRAYDETSLAQLREVHKQVVVARCFALDTARHLSLRGAYPGFLALPDRWISWLSGAVPCGLNLIRRYRPEIIWSTYPIATAHLIALALHRITRIPWVADFRDPMTDEGYPSDRTRRRVYQWIEKRSIENCARSVCTTPGTIRMYKSRFPKIPDTRFCVIANGYDEENFVCAARNPPQSKGQKLTLLHSGVLYPSERDPRPFFSAISKLQALKQISADNLQIVLRATAYDAYLQQLIDQFAIGGIVRLASSISYIEALSEMLAADGLLLFQATNCNHQIPAKLYEYMRARRPILALTDPVGDTASVLRDAGIGVIAPLDSEADIVDALSEFLELVRNDRAPLASDEEISRHSRRSRTLELGRLLESVATQT